MEHADIKNYRTLYIDSKDSQELLHIVDSLDLLLPNPKIQNLKSPKTPEPYNHKEAEVPKKCTKKILIYCWLHQSEILNALPVAKYYMIDVLSLQIKCKLTTTSNTKLSSYDYEKVETFLIHILCRLSKRVVSYQYDTT